MSIESANNSNQASLQEASEQSRSEAKTLVSMKDLGVFFRLRGGNESFIERLRNGFAPGEKHWALKGIDLECREGQVLGVVGHNGAGKSTLCLVLSHILTPDEGELDIQGKVSTLLTLGAGFQRELSGRENIFLYGTFLGISREQIQEMQEAIIEFSEIGDFIDQPVRTYSSGMRARLAFSVATSLEPEILILDEVLSVGDKKFREKCRNRIKQMMDNSKLIVIVSHSMGFLKETCSHCLWLDKGRLKAYGEAKKIIQEYEQA